MIVVDLICEHKHRFEGWFASAEALDSQKASGQLCCPVCESKAVERLPSAPHVARSAESGMSQGDGIDPGLQADPAQPDAAQPDAAQPDAAQQFLRQLVEHIKQHVAGAEDVGEAFTVEVRRIHDGEAEERSIRGVASVAELESLLEEGISVLPIPKDDLH